MDESLNTDSYHHSIFFGKMNISVPIPPPYTREISVL